MAWKVEFHPDAARQLVTLAKRDRVTAQRITSTLATIADLDDPCTRGKGLTGSLAGLWRYRVGDWRVVVDLQDARLVIVALDLNHRSTVYE